MPANRHAVFAEFAEATKGNNLFHSFAQFDLKAGEVATFSGPANIQNILSRVTGGAPSSIDG
ncbi:MAG: filamentous hemagglutinin N-terminal domain-containing protein, partial [Acidobacteriota bacterium]